MPAQELYLEREIAGVKVHVIKTYDAAYAREAFGHMTDEAKEKLWSSLELNENYDWTSGVPKVGSQDYDDILLTEMLETAREDWDKFSYFVVTKTTDGNALPVFVSGDWPTAESYAGSEGLLRPETSHSRINDGLNL